MLSSIDLDANVPTSSLLCVYVQTVLKHLEELRPTFGGVVNSSADGIVSEIVLSVDVSTVLGVGVVLIIEPQVGLCCGNFVKVKAKALIS